MNPAGSLSDCSKERSRNLFYDMLNDTNIEYNNGAKLFIALIVLLFMYLFIITVMYIIHKNNYTTIKEYDNDNRNIDSTNGNDDNYCSLYYNENIKTYWIIIELFIYVVIKLIIITCYILLIELLVHNSLSHAKNGSEKFVIFTSSCFIIAQFVDLALCIPYKKCHV